MLRSLAANMSFFEQRYIKNRTAAFCNSELNRRNDSLWRRDGQNHAGGNFRPVPQCYTGLNPGTAPQFGPTGHCRADTKVSKAADYRVMVNNSACIHDTTVLKLGLGAYHSTSHDSDPPSDDGPRGNDGPGMYNRRQIKS